MPYEIILMKYIIILYLCSYINVEPVCHQGKILAIEFDSYNSCILEGYRQSYAHIKNLDQDRVNEEKMAIKFQCKEINLEKKEV